MLSLPGEEWWIPDNPRVLVIRKEKVGQVAMYLSKCTCHTSHFKLRGNDFRSLLLMSNIAVNFPGLWWWDYFVPQWEISHVVIVGVVFLNCRVTSGHSGSEESANLRLICILSGFQVKAP